MVLGEYSKTKHLNVNRNNMHTIERQKDQLSFSKVKYFRKPNYRGFIKNLINLIFWENMHL